MKVFHDGRLQDGLARRASTLVHRARSLGAPRAGFTLAEVLVVTVIMSSILVGISSVLASARATRDLIHNIQENQLAGPAILDNIERDLRSIFVFGRPPADALRIQDRTLAGRDGDRIDFVTSTGSLAPIFVGNDRLHSDFNEVGYCLRPNPRNDDFLEIYRREGFGVDNEPFSGGRYTFLHDRVKDFNIEVYADETEEDPEPLDEWTAEDEQVGLPARIEITLTLELAPRLVREQIKLADVEKRTVEYRRVIRFPEYLRNAMVVQPLPKIPVIGPPQAGAGDLGGGGIADGGAGGEGLGDGGGFGGSGGFPGGGGGGNTGSFTQILSGGGNGPTSVPPLFGGGG
ncbi:PulJ/GspJ family protein [Engelhardtia mirabilis]|uniref:Pseudopilin GspJ n=1 Tax=Engelhardtia mirabilis TaxID=2528011 RepID=A0A518BJN3_9BACT|nr:Pseudopilin GspJ [Planctomycetes bacterium Pla133]QDV01517.1 Pseudopilin GspJ [Planctomycetes bacterium Pla86]